MEAITKAIGNVSPGTMKLLFWVMLFSLHVLYLSFKKKELTSKWTDELLLVLWSLILLGYALGVIDLIWTAQRKGSLLFG